MKRTSVFAALIQWITSAGLSFRPSRQIPGKWKLYEYYTEKDNELINLKEEQIVKCRQYWELYFETNGQLEQKTNLPVVFLSKAKRVKWHTSRNYIKLMDADERDQKVDFQYAVAGENLKLLKKDEKGRIEFFGFFRKTRQF